MRRKEFAAKVWSKLVAFDKEHALTAPGRRVLAAVSGGPDSVVLTHWLSVLSRRKGFDVALLHVNHGLRGKAADKDADFVRALGKRFGFPVYVVKTSVKSTGQGLEDAGRRERYKALTARAQRGRFAAVATGHQLDDQAETVLLHLLRGTSLEGLGGIAPVRPLTPSISLIRPLLPLTRSEIILYLQNHDLDWRDDATNRDPKFSRNWVRRDVLPLLEERAPGVKARLSALAAKVRAATGRSAGS